MKAVIDFSKGADAWIPDYTHIFIRFLQSQGACERNLNNGHTLPLTWQTLV